MKITYHTPEKYSGNTIFRTRKGPISYFELANAQIVYSVLKAKESFSMISIRLGRYIKVNTHLHT